MLKELKVWHKLVDSTEELLEGWVRHEEYVRQDSVQAIHAAHVMVGMCDGLYQIWNWVQPPTFGFITLSNHHVGACLL